jgi:hypothetical protein
MCISTTECIRPRYTFANLVSRNRQSRQLCLSQSNYTFGLICYDSCICLSPITSDEFWSDSACIQLDLLRHRHVPTFWLSRKDCLTPSPEGDHMKSVPYAPAVGSLMYVMVATRPEIVHAVGVVSRFMHNPGRPPTLERSEAYFQISNWHTRLRLHQIQTERTLRPSWLHRLGLGGLSRHPKIDIRILLQV